MLLNGCDKQINVEDLKALERVVSHKLPSFFKDFYLNSNGGVPARDWWDSEDEYESIRVSKFKSIAAADDPSKEETKYLGGCFSVMTKRGVIPSTLLPFANDDGGNFFCLDLSGGGVCFFATDAFDPEATTLTNQINAYRLLAESFEEFVLGLKDESEIDL